MFTPRFVCLTLGLMIAAPEAARAQNVPAEIVLPSRTWLAVRIQDPLSSDTSRPGDWFTGTLAQPVVMDGIVVARRGQTVAGRVTEVERAGRLKGTSRLGLELVEIAAADGRQVEVQTELIHYSGGSTVNRDAATIGTGAGVGAAIGAAANGGRGAGIGAASGAAASAIAVLLTRGRSTEIDPEAVLTFRTVAPVTIATGKAEHAFERVKQEDYEPRNLSRRPPVRRVAPPFFYGGYWAYPPYFYGPGFSRRRVWLY